MNKKLIKKILIIAGASLLSLVLVLGIVIAAL